MKISIIGREEFYERISETYGIDDINIDNIYDMGKKIVDIGERVHLPDDEGLNYFREIGISKGEKLIVNDLCYYDERIKGVFAVDDAEEFMMNFREMYGEQFFCGDIMIFDIKEKKIWFYHHSGRFGVT